MQVFDYTNAPFTIRADIPEAFREVWNIISQPGNWWRPEDRIAIAQECRHAWACEQCDRAQNALSPVAEDGVHEGVTNLPQPVIEAVHRITRDAPRLSEAWLQAFYAKGYTDGHYVELIGLVVALVSIDAFHLGLNLPLEPLPAPAAGEPNQYRPPGAESAGAWVPVVQPDALTEPEADLYNGAPQTGNVVSAMSLVPDSVRMLIILSNAQYIPMQDVPNPTRNGGRALHRAQIELLAGRVSSLNQCFY